MTTDRRPLTRPARPPADAVALAQSVVDAGVAALAGAGGPDAAQVLAYDVAHAAAAVRTAEAVLAYGAHGETEARIACAFAADAVADLATRTIGRAARVGRGRRLDGPGRGVRGHLPRPGVPGRAGRPAGRPATSTPTSSWCGRPSTDSPRSRSGRGPSTSTGPTPTSPRRSSRGWPRWAASACRSPRSTAGFATGGEADYMGMVVATEELSWGSLGAGGSLITRPEILTRALVHGGTEEQKQHWLPKLATAEVMGAVAVTEPDFGSDVAGVVTAAVPTEGGWLINGVKTWCTFAARADVLMLLARTDPDRAKAHRGLSLFLVEKPRAEGHGFLFTQERRGQDGRPAGSSGRMEGRAIDTLGYRGMHSYEVAFENWFVPDANLVGGEDGLGQGFYLQMQGFENGRLQTAARAIGVMQAAYEAALEYARQPGGVRPADHRLPADPGQAGPDGRAHPGDPPVLLRGGPADVQGRRDASRPR